MTSKLVFCSQISESSDVLQLIGAEFDCRRLSSLCRERSSSCDSEFLWILDIWSFRYER